MQIRYCEFCGHKLLESEAPARGHADLCRKCSSKRDSNTPAPEKVLAQPNSAKSSGTRLPALKVPVQAGTDDSQRPTPPRGLPIATAVGASESVIAPADRVTPQGGVPLAPAAQDAATPTEGPEPFDDAVPPSGDTIFPDGEIPLESPGEAASTAITPSPVSPDVSDLDGAATVFREVPVAPLTSPETAQPAEVAPARITAFYFCEKCGKRVTDADLAAGRARNKQLRGYFCGICAEGAMTLAFEAISQKELLEDALAQEKQTKPASPSDRRTGNTRPQVAKAPPSGATQDEPKPLQSDRRPSNTRLPAVKALSVGSPQEVRPLPLTDRRSSSTRLPASKATTAGSPTAEQNPVPLDRRSTSTRLTASKAVTAGPRRRANFRSAVTQSPGLMIGIGVAVIALVFILISMSRQPGPVSVPKSAAGPEAPVASAPPEQKAKTAPRPPEQKPGGGVPSVPVASPTTSGSAVATTPPLATPPVAVEPVAPSGNPPATPATPSGNLQTTASAPAGNPPATPAVQVSEADLTTGLERVAELAKTSRYGAAQQALEELKTRCSPAEWWAKHEKEWTEESQSLQQQIKDFQDEAREAGKQLQEKPTSELIKQAMDTWGNHARSGDALASSLAKEVLQEAKRAQAKLTIEERAKRQQDIETRLTACEAAVKSKASVDQVDAMLTFAGEVERDILRNPAWETFVPRLQGLRFDARRLREGDMLLYQASSVKPQGGGFELTYGFDTDPFKVWRFNELDRTGTQSGAQWDAQRKVLILQARGTGVKVRQKHVSTATVLLPFDFRPNIWSIEADVTIREIGSDTEPAEFGILLAQGPASLNLFGFKETNSKGSEKVWAFKVDGGLPDRGSTVGQHGPAPTERRAKLQISCNENVLNFFASADGKVVTIGYRNKLPPATKINFVGCYVRTISDVAASAAFDDFKVRGAPNNEVLTARLKEGRDALVNMPLEEWRKQAQTVHGVVAQPSKGPDEMIDTLIK